MTKLVCDRKTHEVGAAVVLKEVEEKSRDHDNSKIRLSKMMASLEKKQVHVKALAASVDEGIERLTAVEVAKGVLIAEADALTLSAQALRTAEKALKDEVEPDKKMARVDELTALLEKLRVQKLKAATKKGSPKDPTKLGVTQVASMQLSAEKRALLDVCASIPDLAQLSGNIK